MTDGMRKCFAVVSALAFLPMIGSILMGMSWASSAQIQDHRFWLLMIGAGISLAAFFRAWRTYYFTSQTHIPKWVWAGLAIGIVQSAFWAWLMRSDLTWMAIVGLPGLIGLDLVYRWVIRSRGHESRP